MTPVDLEAARKVAAEARERGDVAIFAEDDFEIVLSFPSVAEARAFADGVERGGALYGAGKIAAYVLPGDEAEMIECEHIGEVMKAQEQREKQPSPKQPALSALVDQMAEEIEAYRKGGLETDDGDCPNCHRDMHPDSRRE